VADSHREAQADEEKPDEATSCVQFELGKARNAMGYFRPVHKQARWPQQQFQSPVSKQWPHQLVEGTGKQEEQREKERSKNTSTTAISHTSQQFRFRLHPPLHSRPFHTS
jgi:hypothetical protein